MSSRASLSATRFIPHWLAKSKVKNQSPLATNAKQIRDCTWKQNYILDDYVWKDNFLDDVKIATCLLAELRNDTNLDYFPRGWEKGGGGEAW